MIRSLLAFLGLVFAVAHHAAGVDRKVLIIGIDGVRADALLAADTPAISSLITQGAVSWNCQAQDITISGPCWSTILTGVNRNKHLVTSNSFVPNNLAAYPHFFSRIRESCPIPRTASIVHWTPINTQILLGNADVVQSNLSDDGVRDACITLLGQGQATPDIIFLHFDDVDGAGHSSGFSPANPQYLAVIEQTDARIGAVMTALRARPSYSNENWLIIITSDHGGSGTSHGANTPEHRTTALVVSGPSTRVGSTIPNPCTHADVAPTVMAFLGLPVQPSWGWDGQSVGLDPAGLPSQPFECPQRTVIFTENFESVPLGPSINEAPASGVWSGSPPAGWTVDDSGVPGANNPAVGVTEWEGWAFTSKSWWISIAQDQNRSQFTRGVGTIAVADPDEWDDRGTPSTLGTYNARLRTPAINLPAYIEPASMLLSFDSSWRFEGNQRALLTVRFDGGPSTTLLDWRSQAGSFFKGDATNEQVRIPVQNPPNATAMVLEFALLDAGNNWWWAIDNIGIDAVQTPCTLEISQQPQPITSCPAGPATLALTATSNRPITYQWRFNGQPIDPASTPSAITATLNLFPAYAAQQGTYDCIVTDACNSITSSVVTLTVCISDFNCDGGVDGADIESFFTAWESSQPAADVDADGGITGSDIEIFFNAWEGGAC